MQVAANGGELERFRPAEKQALPNSFQLPYEIVVIAAPPGGLQALTDLLSNLPSDFQAPIAIVQHRGITHKSLLARILQRHCKLTVKDAEEHQQIAPGAVYIAPADRHLVVRDDHTFGVFDGTKICHVSSSANPLFVSAAEVFGSRVTAIVLTGGDSAGTDGAVVVKQSGGLVIAQDESTSQQFSMPPSVISSCSADFVLPIDLIGPILSQIVRPRLMRQPATRTLRVLAKSQHPRRASLGSAWSYTPLRRQYPDKGSSEFPTDLSRGECDHPSRRSDHGCA